MPFTFDATVKGASANSYITVADANDYFDGALYRTDWPAGSSGADLALKQTALVTATRHLDRLIWKETRTTFTQRLQWPRVGLVDRDGNYLDADTIPQEIKDATCELALHILQTDPDTVIDESLKQFKHLKIANVLEFELRDGQPNEADLPARVLELISRFLLISSGTTRVIRA